MNDYFCVAPNQKFGRQKIAAKQTVETSPGLLLLTIKVTYIISKKQIMEKLTSQARNTHNMHQVQL
jgi:hypothetical protein